MAMLSTHLSSKKHLVRVKMQSEHRQQGPHGRSHESMHTEQAPGSSGEDTEMKDADQHEGPTMVNKEGDIGTGTDNTTSSSNDKGGRAAEGSSKLCGVRTPTAKQRRRKAERDRKKARARQGHALMDQDAPATDTTLPPANFDEFKPALKPISSGTPLTIASTDLISAPVSKEQFESSAVSSRVICTTDKPSEAKHPDSKTSTDTTNVPTQRWWDCSVCGSHWKKQRGWQGHLESAQHMRRLSQIMREIAPVMAPYGEGDVLASKDTFGWGTAVGAEEEEEEEEEEKDDEDNEDSKDMEMEDQKGAYDVENVAHDDMVLSD
ncbi:hypothetical protein BC939DRAFT_1422 [Gamsiella multidivaricata]|uniref:uncharacterized protein n=1 Tax=Gamsiella multidivaricata TaxID=101098 RepID=UPI00221FE0B7|nr:uncharacterized protein BC939DRAFT_1422 [Gamsiella multidivaricata]KAG0370196.1 hypothetical protein BGZ54_007305 [Gamsiella multidivaricata]KAI7832575.1 hypothetical protein BC939DRAFT_1422 [Gamsiella multidivaricata]